MTAATNTAAPAKATTRKNAEAREKDLRLAMHRIERGRARTGESKLSIAAVAREAGVTTALIHNPLPQGGGRHPHSPGEGQSYPARRQERFAQGRAAQDPRAARRA